MRDIQTERVGRIVIQSGNRVFLPHKLYPSGPDINIGLDIIKLLSEADRALGELKGITTTLPDSDLFVAFYVRKEALLSSQIEGTRCSLDDVLKVDEKERKLEPVSEVVNYIKAMKSGLENLNVLPISKRLIHQIHKNLLEGVRGEEKRPGEYKHRQNWIGPPGSRITEADYIPPPPNSIDDYMDDFEKYYHQKKDLPPLIETAILHSHFETIHPYSDGNGRLGRLLITFMLCERQVLDEPLLYLSLFFKENKADYYELLMNVRFNGDWEEWIRFFLRGVRNTSLEAIDTANKIKNLQETDRLTISRNLAQYKLSFKCYDLICRRPIISITEAARNLNTNYPSVKQTFENFIKVGILDLYDETVKRNRLFVYSKYLEILRKGT
jgi:Fic family protein